MKRIILLFVVMFAFTAISTAQTWRTNQTIVGDAYGTWFGVGTHDTVLTSSIWTEHLVRLKSENPLDIQIVCKFTKISGTVTGTKVLLYAGNDSTNVNLVALDSITIGGDASGIVAKNLDDFNYSYLRLRGVGVGSSGKTKLDLFYSIRKE